MATQSLYVKTLSTGVKVYVAGCTICNMPPKNNVGDFIGRCEFCTDKAVA